MLVFTGQTLVQVHVATAQLLQLPCKSMILYDHPVVQGSFMNHVNVIHVERTDHQHTTHEYQAYHVLVVPPGSVPAAVKRILFHSTAVQLRLLAVGATLVQVPIHHVHILPLH